MASQLFAKKSLKVLLDEEIARLGEKDRLKPGDLVKLVVE